MHFLSLCEIEIVLYIIFVSSMPYFPAEPKRRNRGLNRDESDNSDEDKENREFKTPRKGKTKCSSKSTNKRKKTKKPFTFVDDDENDEIELFSDV